MAALIETYHDPPLLDFHQAGGLHETAVQLFRLYYLPKCWPCEKLKRIEEYPPSRFLVITHEMLALLSFPVVLRDYTLITLDP